MRASLELNSSAQRCTGPADLGLPEKIQSWRTDAVTSQYLRNAGVINESVESTDFIALTILLEPVFSKVDLTPTSSMYDLEVLSKYKHFSQNQKKSICHRNVCAGCWGVSNISSF